MLADIKGPHLDFLGGANGLSHGSDPMYSTMEKLQEKQAFAKSDRLHEAKVKLHRC